MIKYQILLNNLERVTNYVEINEWEVKYLQMNSLFSHPKVKKLGRKVPKKFDKVSISKFFNETGLKIKYIVFTDQFSSVEYDRMGAHPDNDKWAAVQRGEMTLKEFISHPEYMEVIEEPDIIVIDKISEDKYLRYFKSNAFLAKKENVLNFFRRIRTLIRK